MSNMYDVELAIPRFGNRGSGTEGLALPGMSGNSLEAGAAYGMMNSTRSSLVVG
jgi:hypothetical protein